MRPVLPLSDISLGAVVPTGRRVVGRLVAKLEVQDLFRLILRGGHCQTLCYRQAVVAEIECRDKLGAVREVIPALEVHRTHSRAVDPAGWTCCSLRVARRGVKDLQKSAQLSNQVTGLFLPSSPW